jgi:FHS family L-fucose permease-like MFS transporter
MASKNQSGFSFVMLVALFFLWGLLTSLNDTLVQHLQQAFQLKYWQAQLIQFFFFGAYFVMSWPSGVIIRRLGYKRGIVLGLALMGLGCLLFYPATVVRMYGVFLLALFILASGITILQVAANPYVAVLGSPETAASRLNLAQGFNSLGHTIAPLVGAVLILQNVAEGQAVEVRSLQVPYIALAVTLWLIAVLFNALHLPSIQYEEKHTRSFSIFDYPQLYLGALAIFFYVGAEISVGSFLALYFKSDPTIAFDNKTAGAHVAFYWGSAMIGRFMGAIALSGKEQEKRRPFYMAAVPLFAFLVVLGIVSVRGMDYTMAFGFLAMLVLNYFAFFLGKSMPSRLLAVFALFNMVLLAVTMTTGGQIALWTVLGIGLFNSIMWSNIFTLAIDRLKEFTSYGSSFLVMMIVGGAILPPLQGILADVPSVGVKYSFMVPLVAYAYLVFYGLRGYRPRNLV